MGHTDTDHEVICDHAWSTRADGEIRFCIKCGKDGSSRALVAERLAELEKRVERLEQRLRMVEPGGRQL